MLGNRGASERLGSPWRASVDHGDLHPLVNIQKANWKMVIEIVDLPIKNGGSFHSYVNVYQRVKQQTSLEDHLQIEHDGRDWYSVSAIFSYELNMVYLPTSISHTLW